MKLRSVQAMRAAAALLVLIAHLLAVDKNHSGETSLIAETWVNGVSGVDLFFVISGFIMIWVAGDFPAGLRSSTRFLLSRIMRIYPLWWLFASIMAVYFWVSYGVPWDAENLLKHDLTGPEHLFRSYGLLPQPTFPVLGVGWTLVHEMYFYLGFAGLLLVPARFRPHILALWALGVIVGSVSGLSGPYAVDFRHLIFYPTTFEFIMGAFVALIIKNGYRQLGGLALGLGLTLYCVSFLWFNFNTGGALLGAVEFKSIGTFTLGWGRTLFFGLPSALIIYGLVTLELTRNLGRIIPNFVVSLGDWSYAIYLSHMIVISAVARLIFPRFAAPGSFDNAVFMVLSIIAVIILSALTYKLVEAPFMRWCKPRLSRLDHSSN